MGNTLHPLTCCYSSAKPPRPEFLRVSVNHVELAISVLGGVAGFTAYHTSVVVGGEEFFFSPMGINRNRGLESHNNFGGFGAQQVAESLHLGGSKPGPEVIDMGCSAKSGDMMLRALGPYFDAGSYDLLHKNCNSFTDMALFYLLGKRLDSTYNSIEKLGASNPRLMEQLTRGAYRPNPASLEFNAEQLLSRIDSAEREDGLETPNGSRVLPIGTVVRIEGLKSEAACHLNGTLGITQRFRPETGRYEVRVGSEAKALKPENLDPFHMHQEMCIQGLQNATHLNGERCTLSKYIIQTDRFEIKVLSTGEVKALKTSNLHSV